MRKLNLTGAAILLCLIFFLSGCVSTYNGRESGIDSAASGQGSTDGEPDRAEEFLLDTLVTAAVYGGKPDTVDNLMESIKTVSEAVELAYNYPTSELDKPIITAITGETAKLNAVYGYDVRLDIGALTRLWGISGDNPTVPADEEIQKALTNRGFLDPGAVAKGYAMDCAFDILSQSNADYAVISAESSLLLYGEKTDGTPFTVGVKSPDGGYAGYIETQQAFISTSGGYERFFEADGVRYSHILDPATGYPVVTDLAAVTVIVPADTKGGGQLSDFLSTLIFMNGTEGLAKFNSDDSFRYIAIDESGNVYGNYELLPLNE
jgi:thiamine biosynthesis lipoprotein